MTDHRDFKRDRETHRDRDRVLDYERDRFDRERRPRDDRYAMKKIRTYKVLCVNSGKVGFFVCFFGLLGVGCCLLLLVVVLR